MADETKKKISADDRLRAFALFTMAKQHSKEAENFANGLARLLGRRDMNDLDHLGDMIWGEERWSFDEALSLTGFAVEE